MVQQSSGFLKAMVDIYFRFYFSYISLNTFNSPDSNQKLLSNNTTDQGLKSDANVKIPLTI